MHSWLGQNRLQLRAVRRAEFLPLVHGLDEGVRLPIAPDEHRSRGLKQDEEVEKHAHVFDVIQVVLQLH